MIIFIVSITGDQGGSLTNLQVKLALMTSLGQRNWEPVEFSSFLAKSKIVALHIFVGVFEI